MNSTKLLMPQKRRFTWKNVLKFLVLCTPLLLLSHLFSHHHHHGAHHHAQAPAASKFFLAPNVTPEMLTADFWVARTPDASEVLLNPLESRVWNQLEEGEKGAVIFDFVEFDGLKTRKEIVRALAKDLAGVREMKLFGRNRELVSEDDLKNFEESQNISSIPESVPVQYGILARDSDVRLLATHEIFTQEPGDLEFDEFQNSKARAFTCLRILHTSKDGSWFYVQLPDVHGWVSVGDVALVPNRRAARSLSEPDSFLAVLGDAVTAYTDPEFKVPFMQLRMGTRLSLISSKDPISHDYTVLVPIKGSSGLVDLAIAYIKKSDDVRVGYLPFTRENILRQAFKLLGKPYGWGGLWKARDCSSFLQDVFFTMGVLLPRNSKSQAEAGSYFVQFSEKTSNQKKKAALDEAPPVTSLLRLNGHIMLYLGKVNGRHYAIHNSSGYRVPRLFQADEVHKLNQVIVSDMSLGKGSRKKSLLERLISINTVV